MSVVLHGYRYSVYHRIARMVLAEKRVAHAIREVDPFAPTLPDGYRALHPFGRVPALCHGSFTLYETAAIARYVDAAFPGPALTPPGPRAAARMAQVVAVVDAYGYWPMIRQVFAHDVFGPMMGETGSTAEISAGLAGAETVLGALDRIAAEGEVLNGEVTLADCHLAPVMDYFTRAAKGAAALAGHPALTAWWAGMARRPSLVATDPLAGRGQG